jgi:hypothetical protein
VRQNYQCGAIGFSYKKLACLESHLVPGNRESKIAMNAVHVIIAIVGVLIIGFVWYIFFAASVVSFKDHPLWSSVLFLASAGSLAFLIYFLVSGQSPTQIPGPGPCAPLSSCPTGDYPLNGQTSGGVSP